MSINSFGPFYADVWGTVSDWAIVVVTTLTAIFIYQTFREQLKVTKDQSELLNIERIKLRDQFKTELEVSGGNDWNGVNTIWVNIKAINHNAHNLSIKNLSKAAFPIEIITPQREFLKMETWVDVIKKEAHHEDLSNEYNLSMTYEDVNGESYSQLITGTFENPKISPPSLLKKR